MKMPSVINAVLQCYGGDCSDCAEKSAGTCAGGDSNNWFVRSRSLREFGITALQPSETHIQTMPEILLRSQVPLPKQCKFLLLLFSFLFCFVLVLFWGEVEVGCGRGMLVYV